jgi:alcohol dehydrogenase
VEVPEDVSDGLALLAILSCDVAKGIRKVAPSPEEPVLVTGAGAIGLLTVFVLRAYGTRNVDVVEPLAQRRRPRSVVARQVRGGLRVLGTRRRVLAAAA